jgi:1,5-anhydro-D-fructose reductase (1,5-anhydro-D-mannitol-forming)
MIGCGDVAERKSGPAFQRAPGSRLVAVACRTPGHAEAYARSHGVARAYERADALLDDPAVDAVYVATPPGSHLELALRVAASGRPCYVEKPLARSAAEARAMVEAFEKAGLPLFVAHYRRAWPRFAFVREVVQGGRIGTLTSIEAVCARPMQPDDPASLPWRLRADESGGGLFVDLAPHTLDVVDAVAGPIQHATGTAVRGAAAYAVEQAVSLAFAAGGAVGSGVWNFGSAVREDRLVFTGTAGRVSTPVFDAGPLVLETAAGRTEHPFPPPDPVQLPLVAQVTQALLGRGTCEATGAAGLRTMAVMDAALAGYYGGRADAFWDRPDTWPGARR